MWQGGRGKAERAKGRAGSETSGESVGKWIMINTCIWFQWLPGRLEKAPAGLQWGGSNEQREREPYRRRRAKQPPPKKSAEFCLRFDTSVLFCVIKHPFSGSPPLTSSSFLPWPSNRVTLVPKPGTRKPARRRHATRQPHPTCGASQVARWSSSGATSGADGHEAGAGGSLPAIGPGAGWRPAGHPELARPGGNPRRSSIDRPRPADEDGTPRWPGGLRGSLREDSGGVWLGAQPVAGAPDPTADGGSAGSSPTVACRQPPGLWRPKAGHPSTRRPEPRASPTLPLHGARGLRPTVRDGSAAPGRMPQVALGRATWRRSDRPGGAGAVRRPTTPANGRVGPVPPPDVAGPGHPAGGGPSVGVPRGRRAPA